MSNKQQKFENRQKAMTIFGIEVEIIYWNNEIKKYLCLYYDNKGRIKTDFYSEDGLFEIQ